MKKIKTGAVPIMGTHKVVIGSGELVRLLDLPPVAVVDGVAYFGAQGYMTTGGISSPEPWIEVSYHLEE